jgi:hypothetical protein
LGSIPNLLTRHVARKILILHCTVGVEKDQLRALRLWLKG